MPTTSSITLFERISPAISWTVARTSSSIGPSTVSSKRLPTRTPVTPPRPVRASARATALPCGSSSSALGITSTTIVGTGILRSLGRRGGGSLTILPCGADSAVRRCDGGRVGDGTAFEVGPQPLEERRRRGSRPAGGEGSGGQAGVAVRDDAPLVERAHPQGEGLAVVF